MAKIWFSLSWFNGVEFLPMKKPPGSFEAARRLNDGLMPVW